MEFKVIVTTDILNYTQIKDRGYCEQEEVEYTDITNTLFPVTTPFPPIKLSALDLGEDVKRNVGSPYATINRIEFIEPEKINIELTNLVNQRLKKITKNWINFIYFEFYNQKVYSTAIIDGQENAEQLINDWAQLQDLPVFVIVCLKQVIESHRISTNNTIQRQGFIFAIKKVNEEFIIEKTDRSIFYKKEFIVNRFVVE